MEVEEQVKKGISSKHITILIEFSLNDPQVLKFTSDNKRYSSLKNFQKNKHKRYYYSLIGENNDLAGLIWFTKKSIPIGKYNHKFEYQKYGLTFALRIYDKYRGKGLSYPFLKSAYFKYKKTNIYKTNKNNKLWIRVNKNNVPALKTYYKFGLKNITDTKLHKKLILIEE